MSNKWKTKNMFEIAIGIIVGSIIVVLFIVERAIGNLPASHWISKKLKGKETGSYSGTGFYGGDLGGPDGGSDFGGCD